MRRSGKNAQEKLVQAQWRCIVRRNLPRDVLSEMWSHKKRSRPTKTRPMTRINTTGRFATCLSRSRSFRGSNRAQLEAERTPTIGQSKIKGPSCTQECVRLCSKRRCGQRLTRVQWCCILRRNPPRHAFRTGATRKRLGLTP